MKLEFEGEDEILLKKSFNAPSSGIALGMYNLIAPLLTLLGLLWIKAGMASLLSTKNTILKAYDGRFKDLFQKFMTKNSKKNLKQKNCIRT